MKNTYTLWIAAFIALSTYTHAQKKEIAQVTESVQKSNLEAHLSFLAADEMRGRNTGSPEIHIAANYLASWFKQLGVAPVSGKNNYFQDVPLVRSSPAKEATLTIDDQSFRLKDEVLVLQGTDVQLDGEMIFVGYGSSEDMGKQSLQGKIVVALTGTAGENNGAKVVLVDSPEKRARATEAGAKALIEILVTPGIAWPGAANYFSQTIVQLDRGPGSIPHLWLKNVENEKLNRLKETRNAHGSFSISGRREEKLTDKNVVGWIEGIDPKLNKEFVVFSAHYDHVGVGKVAGDSIFNGARDNAVGTVGLMEVARYFMRFKPKRSILLLAVAAEEVGLLGSEWYANHPLIPLQQTVFNFNCDGAGYNDKSIATVIGLERTSAESDIVAGAAAFGLKALPDPVPEQNLYERSDNVNFAMKGIPAIDFAPGIKAFDEELFKYYHQPADEVNSLDFDYLLKYYRSLVYATSLIANKATRPTWKAGDKFEEIGKKLYGTKP